MLLNVLYQEVIESITNPRDIPMKIDRLAFDERFMPDYACEELDEMSHGVVEPDWFYKFLFNELANMANHDLMFGTPILQIICESQDINESPEHGDYTYHAGELSPQVPFLYMEASHPWAIPSRLILYDPLWQIEVNSDQKEILVFPCAPRIRNLFFIEPLGLKRMKITEYLEHTERPNLAEL